MESYPQQHEPWRPDFPPMWNVMFKGLVFDVSDKEMSTSNKRKNIITFERARRAINKAMKT